MACRLHDVGRACFENGQLQEAFPTPSRMGGVDITFQRRGQRHGSKLIAHNLSPTDHHVGFGYANVKPLALEMTDEHLSGTSNVP